MKLPNIPTPPPQTDVMAESPRTGEATATRSNRPRSDPPPQFPDDDQFQPMEEHRRRKKAPRKPDPEGITDDVGEIRLCEEMAADLSEQSRQSRRDSSVLESSFEALDSSIGEEGVDFLSNLKFEGDPGEG